MFDRSYIDAYKKKHAGKSREMLEALLKDFAVECDESVALRELITESDEAARAKKEKEEERRHWEIIEATKRLEKAAKGGDKSKKVVYGIAITLATGVIVGLIVAYMKGCFPEVLR